MVSDLRRRVCGSAYSHAVGRLIYGADPKSSFGIDDRLLAHLRIAVMNKLRRGEPFMLTVPDEGSGLRSIWLAPMVPVVFQMYGGRAPVIDTRLVNRMLNDASSPDGLHLSDRYESDAPAG
jgi:hypothetical protein